MTLTHLLGQQVNILFVAAVRGVVQLNQGQRLHTHRQHCITQQTVQNTLRLGWVVEPLTWVVAVMESTKVGTVEQLRFSRRPCRRSRKMEEEKEKEEDGVVSMENCKALQSGGRYGEG